MASDDDQWIVLKVSNDRETGPLLETIGRYARPDTYSAALTRANKLAAEQPNSTFVCAEICLGAQASVEVKIMYAQEIFNAE